MKVLEREGEGIPSPRSMGGEPRAGGIGVVGGWPLNIVGGGGEVTEMREGEG